MKSGESRLPVRGLGDRVEDVFETCEDQLLEGCTPLSGGDLGSMQNFIRQIDRRLHGMAIDTGVRPEIKLAHGVRALDYLSLCEGGPWGAPDYLSLCEGLTLQGLR
mgnify:CR=1 FL=1